MKVIIAGGREVTNPQALTRAIADSGFEITEVVSGGARGADYLGQLWAEENGIPLRHFLPDWLTHGKSGGPIRNRKMAEYAEALIALWDGSSRGTKNMIEEAKKRGLKVHVHLVG